jgi:outer membrane biosynthesis protein TonB
MAPPKPIREVAPMAAASIRTRIDDEIPVNVTMRIGANGSVVGAQAATAEDGIQAYLVQRSLEAVRQWKFSPARLGPDPVPSKWTVRFRFDKAGVDWN